MRGPWVLVAFEDDIRWELLGLGATAGGLLGSPYSFGTAGLCSEDGEGVNGFGPPPTVAQPLTASSEVLSSRRPSCVGFRSHCGIMVRLMCILGLIWSSPLA